MHSHEWHFGHTLKQTVQSLGNMFDGLSLIDTGLQSFEVVVAVGEHKEVVIDYLVVEKV